MILAVLLASCAVDHRADESHDDGSSPRSSFLREFLARSGDEVFLEDVDLPASAGGASQALLARPRTAEKLPALLVVPPEGGIRTSYRRVLRELAEVGYSVLGLDLPPSSPPPVVAGALRWLRSCDGVDPGRTGVIGFSTGCGAAWAAAVSESAQACVLVGDPGQPPLLEGPGGEAPRTLVVVGSLPSGAPSEQVAGLPSGSRFLKVVSVEAALPAFLLPGSPFFGQEDSDRVWVEIYEFLGRHVEDAGPEPSTPMADAQHVLRVVDIMRSVNSASGVRGRLAERLNEGPRDEREWNLVQAQAALLAESARILEQLPPPRGHPATWRRKSATFRLRLDELLARVRERDPDGARSALERLQPACAGCHQAHR